MIVGRGLAPAIADRLDHKIIGRAVRTVADAGPFSEGRSAYGDVGAGVLDGPCRAD